ncbi:hypothetical protein B0I00_0538 [Novosphingobium kunmingense]|uniref:DUF2946 domain-containing protein n=1 Tax=Novosphingobium kunmingense TaxID=1211806 RepID=A0A2N0I2D6_9SPHN|nr:hypothetical protein B0I00_0538 [Novosphingobium kunmingense]
MIAPRTSCAIAGFRVPVLDSIQQQAENVRMRRAHKLALILGVLLGLFGQIVTVAASPAVATAVSGAAPAMMPMDCVGMMQDDGEKSLPCQQMTLACLAGMGCLPLFAVNNRSSPVAEMVSTDLLLISPSYPALLGRSTQPEQHPPNTLA